MSHKGLGEKARKVRRRKTKPIGQDLECSPLRQRDHRDDSRPVTGMVPASSPCALSLRGEDSRKTKPIPAEGISQRATMLSLRHSNPRTRGTGGKKQRSPARDERTPSAWHRPSFAPAGFRFVGPRYPPLKRWAMVNRPCGTIWCGRPGAVLRSPPGGARTAMRPQRGGGLTGSAGGYRLIGRRGSALGDTGNRYGKEKSWARGLSHGRCCISPWFCSC